MRTRSVLACVVVMMVVGDTRAAPQTKAPQTKAPQTKAPQTKAPLNKAPLNKTPQNTVLPMRKPIVVLPKPPTAIVPRLPKATGTTTRVVELRDVSGAHRFKVTLATSNAVDGRVLDYLAKALRIAPISPAVRADLDAWARHPGPDAPGADVTVTLARLDGASAKDFLALPPAGVDQVRPGVLRVREELLAALAKKRDVTFTDTTVAGAKAALRPNGRPLQGTLKCRSRGLAGRDQTLELKSVKVRVGDIESTTDGTGAFTLPGSFHPGSVTFEVVYDAPITTGSGAAAVTSPLRVMGEFHTARSESVTRTASRSGERLTVGDVVLTSVDCEIWRLGVEVLDDYQSVVKRPPPAGGLRIKRWAAVDGGAPYTYFDHIVLATDFARAGRFSDPAQRRGMFFHEMGHSIRHVADGDEVHWGWDNFRWAYARVHDGCETFNTQYAFNEGWAGYWADARGPDHIPPCDATDSDPRLDPSTDKLIDWKEAKVARHLRRLAEALSTDVNVSAPKMVDVLVRNKGAIHSLRDFEVRYCALYPTSSACRGPSSPKRAAPAPCPPEYINLGETCRLDNIIAKESYPRGAGTVPKDCGPGRELDAGLCYPLTGVRGDRTLTSCRTGFAAVGPVCWQSCPAGFRDDGAFCAKPAAYTRAGYPWKFGDAPFDLSAARQRCLAANPGGCEQNGLMFYPTCRANYHAFGCCVCTPDCPSGMADIGVSCQKQSYTRGAGTVPTGCGSGMELDAGLCYRTCRAGFEGVGPVCWKSSCPTGWADHGATCYRDPAIIVR